MSAADGRLAFFCKQGMDSFLRPIMAHFRQRGCEVRLYQAETLPDPQLGRLIAQGETCWFEWCDEVFVRASRRPEARLARLVCRLHSYEAFSPFPREVNWEAASDLIFVAPHIKEIVESQVEGLAQRCRLHVVPNAVDLDKLPFRRRQKGFNVAYLGYLNFKKGPMLLLQAARAMAKADSRYRLHIGGAFQEPRYALYFQQMVKEMGLGGNVSFEGWIKDVDAWLADKHYLISTSVLEGHPVGVLEGMAKGLKPLIHNFYGAARVFPREFLWNDLDELIALLRGDYEPERYRRFVEEGYGLPRQMAQLEAVLFPARPGGARPAPEEAAPAPAPGQPQPAAQAAAVSPPAEADTALFYHPLPRRMKVVTNRKSFVAEYCRGKKVLHVGCVDAGIMHSRLAQNSFLHSMLLKTAARVWGVDCDEEGIRHLEALGIKDLFCLNAEALEGLVLEGEPDIIVASEVLEHMSNPGNFLQAAKRFNCPLLVSVPNAFSYRAISELSKGRELVHADHNCYFSYTTLNTFIAKHGYRLSEAIAYFWPLNDEIGKAHLSLMHTNPFFGDGFIFIVSPAGEGPAAACQLPPLAAAEPAAPRGSE
jgi:glycosyltransferase involved in cell wall biosynthesis